MKLFHYTDATALKSIITENELWFTHINYMNDSAEFSHGNDIFMSQINEILKDPSDKLMALNAIKVFENKINLYVGCFCKDEIDKLSQWRGYCPKNGGYAIEFKYNGSGNIQECIYEEEAQKLIAKEYTNTIIELRKKYEKKIDGIDQPLIIDQAEAEQEFLSAGRKAFFDIGRIKHTGFEEENEYRFLQWVMPSESKHSPNVEFRERNGLIIPFIKSKIAREAISIEAIWVGPMENQELAKNSLEMFLKSKELDIPVKKSKISYRG